MSFLLLYLFGSGRLEWVDHNRVIDFKAHTRGFSIRHLTGAAIYDKEGLLIFKVDRRTNQVIETEDGFLISWIDAGSIGLDVFDRAGQRVKSYDGTSAFFYSYNDGLLLSLTSRGAGYIKAYDYPGFQQIGTGFWSPKIFDNDLKYFYSFVAGEILYIASPLSLDIEAYHLGSLDKSGAVSIERKDFVGYRTSFPESGLTARDWFRSFSRIVGMGVIGKKYYVAYETKTETTVLILDEGFGVEFALPVDAWGIDKLLFGGSDGRALFGLDPGTFEVYLLLGE